ncbi:hypothetical protein ACET3Z_032203 [Daucus carota]
MKNSSVMLFISLAMILAISGLRLSNGLAEGIVARAPYHAGAPNHILNAYDCSKDESICSKRCPGFCFNCYCDKISKTCNFHCEL